MSYFFPGDTVTVGASDLEFNDVPVTAGATVTIQLFNPSGAQVGADIPGVVSGDDWTANVNLPTTPLGKYIVKVTATNNGATWHGKRELWIRSF